MHLLSANPGGFVDEDGIIDLQQTPADIVVLSSQDSALSLLAKSIDQLPETFPSVRLANILHLSKPAALDLYVDAVLQHSKIIVVSLLGGVPYWRYGVESLTQLAQQRSIQLAFLPGDGHHDSELVQASNVTDSLWTRLWRYLREGGLRNAQNFFYCLQHFYFDKQVEFEEPRILPGIVVYHPNLTEGSLQLWQQDWQRMAQQDGHSGSSSSRHNVALVFYRSHIQSGNTYAFDHFIRILKAQGLNPLPIAVSSLKDAENLTIINQLCVRAEISLIINTTGFAVSATKQTASVAGNANISAAYQQEIKSQSNPCFAVDVPVMQCIMSSASEQDWQQYALGLRARDIAMNIALPEMDGRIITRAISFKKAVSRCEKVQADIIEYRLKQDRAEFVAKLVSAWCDLAKLPNCSKRVALILANYPTLEGRIGNGVGLDTPASVLNLLKGMKTNGFAISDIPQNASSLMAQLLSSVTNDPDNYMLRTCYQSISLQDYERHFAQLPIECQKSVLERWGSPAEDHKVRQGRIMVAGIRLNNIFVGIQPTRGYNLDISATYHDPDLVPPHSYLAFYFWLKYEFGVHAMAHIGKHGNLEWLPGKSIALSSNCWPEIALGPMPHIYPFIVNDPGEGAQAKRRSQAVIIDHLMPPMARAETYGELQVMEQLVDEYYQAYGMDKQRSIVLEQKIIKHIKANNLFQEIGASNNDNEDTVLNRLDTYLCELKEAQIRDGLHILGEYPQDIQLVDTLVALIRVPRGSGDYERGILHTLADDLGIAENYDPLSAAPAQLWTGIKPELLEMVSNEAWRSQGDTRERLELLARQLIMMLLNMPNTLLGRDDKRIKRLFRTSIVLEYVREVVLIKLIQCGELEINNFIGALQGRFVNPGPSGAPTRGRMDVLPTGRNFYSIDTRVLPTPTAWQIGKQSADLLLQRYVQEHGEYPQSLGLSVWGTANMRTGGDDIAQAFALMGVKPVWEKSSYRVVDIEIIPVFILNRPRVDVSLRISGFFRDAFPNIIKLYDTAVKALADYDDPGEENTIRQRILRDYKRYMAQGVDKSLAYKQASWRIFGSKPGAYGAGLQGLIDERCWQSQDDLATAYVNWSGYAYDQQDAGMAAHDVFVDHLSQMQVVVQNQDNREHDILDSDDYYQFQGGLANAVKVHSGKQPTIYHADHANPELPRIRSLKEELNRVIRSRVINPKWINSMRRHGYKGAFEMAATVDYLFAYDATTNLVDDYQYQLVCENLLFDAKNRQFLNNKNPQAMSEMAERMLEAIQRGMWTSDSESIARLEQLLLDAEQTIEN